MVSRETGPHGTEPGDADHAAAVGPVVASPYTGVHHVVPAWYYLAVYAALLVLTALTVIAAYQDLGAMNNVVALGIAITKASLVVLIFMGLRWSSRLVSLFLGAGVFLFLYLLAGTFGDYFTRDLIGVPGR